METLRESFGRRLRNLRKGAKYSAEELAEKLDVHPNTVYCLERGEQWISSELLEKLATTLNTHTWAFFHDTTPPSNTVQALLDLIGEQESRLRELEMGNGSSLFPEWAIKAFKAFTPKDWDNLKPAVDGILAVKKLKQAQEGVNLRDHRPK